MCVSLSFAIAALPNGEWGRELQVGCCYSLGCTKTHTHIRSHFLPPRFSVHKRKQQQQQLVVPLICQLMCEMTPAAGTPPPPPSKRRKQRKWCIALIAQPLQSLANCGRVWHIAAVSGSFCRFSCLGKCLYPCLTERYWGISAGAKGKKNWTEKIGWRPPQWIFCGLAFFWYILQFQSELQRCIKYFKKVTK